MTPDENVGEVVPFLGVRDMERPWRFYVDGLGFSIAKQWVDDGKLRWCWMTKGRASLMMQEFWKDGVHDGHPPAKLGQGVSLSFQCRDALAIYREAVERGLRALEPFVGNSMWVVGLIDPDGYRIEFQSPTDVPEETRFSEWNPA